MLAAGSHVHKTYANRIRFDGYNKTISSKSIDICAKISESDLSILTNAQLLEFMFDNKIGLIGMVNVISRIDPLRSCLAY